MLHKSFCSTFLISGDAVDEDSGEPGESERGMVMLRYSDSDNDSDSDSDGDIIMMLRRRLTVTTQDRASLRPRTRVSTLETGGVVAFRSADKRANKY